MKYNNKQSKTYMNRAERRKNNIKTPKVPKNTYTNEELERIIKRELMALLNESYSETIKRERYQRLQPLIEKYQKEKAKQITNQTQAKNNRNAVYQKQKAELNRKELYQKLNNKSVKQETAKPVTTNYKNQKAIQAYQTQMAYSSTKSVLKEETIEKVNTQRKVEPTKKKKGFFRKVVEALNLTHTNPKTEVKPTLSKPKARPQTTYTNPRNLSRPKDYVYNEFKKRIRDMRNFCNENPTYKIYKNGRQINLRERYL